MVSIIVPVYNAVKYLPQCIDSLLNQTYADIEVLLVDDGSEDGSSDICRQYTTKDNRVRYIFQKNQGVSVARNTGLHSAKGEWVCFVDSDDWATPDMVAKLLKDANGYDIVVGDVYVEKKEKTIQTSFFPVSYSDNQKRNKYSLLGNAVGCAYYGCGRYCNIGVVWARIYRKDFLLENNLQFPIGVRRMQDTIFNFNVFLKSPKIHFCGRPIYYYRITDGSVCHRYDPHYDEVISQISSALNVLIGKDGNPEIRKICDYKKVSLLLENIKLQYAHPKCPLSYKDRVKGIQQLFTSNECSAAVRDCDGKLLSSRQRIVLGLLTHQLYGAVLVLYKIKNILSR